MLNKTQSVVKSSEDYVEISPGRWKPVGMLPEVEGKRVNPETGEVLVQVNHIDNKQEGSQWTRSPQEMRRRFKLKGERKWCGRWSKVFRNSSGELKKGVRLLCQEWFCKYCYPRLKANWKAKFFEVQIHHVISYREGNWDAFRKRLRRERGKKFEYCVVKGNGQWFVFFATEMYDYIHAWSKPYLVDARFHAYQPCADTLNRLLEEALCFEEKPLDHRKKIRHSRGFFPKPEVPEAHGPPTQDQGTWSTVPQTLEAIAADHVQSGGSVRWLSQDEALFDKPTPSGRPPPTS